MELILGIPPMSQYDAAATPLWRCFTATPDYNGYTSLPINVDLNDKNLAWNELASRSEQFDFTKEDRINDLDFSDVIWKAVKGEQSKMPAPRRAAFVKLPLEKDADDE